MTESNWPSLAYGFIPLESGVQPVYNQPGRDKITGSIGWLPLAGTVWKSRFFKKYRKRGFPGGAVVENLPANAGDTGSSPGLGKSHMPWSN